MMKKLSIVLSVLLISSSVAAETITLKQAIEIGLAQNFAIQVARNDARSASIEAGRGTAVLLPTIDGVATIRTDVSDDQGNSPTAVEDLTTYTKTAALNLNWTLFDGFRMFAERGRYRDLSRLGEAAARERIELSVVQIAAAYFDLSRQQQLYAVAERSLAVSDARYERQKVRSELGSGSTTDLLNAQVAANADRSSLITARLAVDAARRSLNILLGREPNSELTVVAEIALPEVETSLDSLQSMAATQNASLERARRSLQVAQHAVGSSRASFLPRVSLGASVGLTDQTLSSDSPSFGADRTTDRSSYGAGLTLTWNLFNGGNDRISYRVARLAEHSRRIELAEAKLSIRAAVADKLDAYNARLELVALQQENTATARRNLELQESRLATGAVGSVEFRDAQRALVAAETGLITARFDARLARLELERLIGTLILR
jgi:outer membrane protein TolC